MKFIFGKTYIICLLNCFTLSSNLFAQKDKDYPASKFPDRIILGFKGNPAISQAVNWRTDEHVSDAVAACIYYHHYSG